MEDFLEKNGYHFLRTSWSYINYITYVVKLHRYFLLSEKGEKMKEQLGIVRTNCIDCLDRTNVTQASTKNNYNMLLEEHLTPSLCSLLFAHPRLYCVTNAEHDRSQDVGTSTQKDWYFWRRRNYKLASKF